MANLGVNIGVLQGGLTAPLQYPFVNGFRPSWASIEFKISIAGGAPGSAIIGMQSIDYKISRERKKTQGTNVKPLAKTRGKVDFTCKIKLLLAEWTNLIAQLAAQDPTGNNAYGDVFFQLNVKYAEANMAIINDTILGCTIDSAEQSSADGSDDIMVESELNPLDILRSGPNGVGLSISNQVLGAPNF